MLNSNAADKQDSFPTRSTATRSPFSSQLDRPLSLQDVEYYTTLPVKATLEGDLLVLKQCPIPLLSASDSLGRTPLIAAIYGLDTLDVNLDNLDYVQQTHPQHMAVFKYLLNSIPNVAAQLNARYDVIHGITPLILAAYFGKHDLVLAMLEAGADVDAPDSQNATALMYAARDNHVRVLQLLLRYKASPEKRDINGWSALEYGYKYDSARELLENSIKRKYERAAAKAKMSSSSSRPLTSASTPSFLTASNAQSAAASAAAAPPLASPITETAPRKSLQLDIAAPQTTMDGDTTSVTHSMLFAAIQADDVPLWRQLLRNPTSHPLLNMLDQTTGLTVLHQALRHLNAHTLEFVSALFELRAFPQQASRASRADTAVSFASSQDNSRSSFVNPNIPSNSGRTALHYLAAAPHVRTVLLPPLARLLLDNGAHVNVADRMGTFPLHLACENNHGDLVELLIEQGATIHVQNRKNLMPMDLATDPDIVRKLKRFSSDQRDANQPMVAATGAATVTTAAAAAPHKTVSAIPPGTRLPPPQVAPLVLAREDEDRLQNESVSDSAADVHTPKSSDYVDLSTDAIKTDARSAKAAAAAAAAAAASVAIAPAPSATPAASIVSDITPPSIHSAFNTDAQSFVSSVADNDSAAPLQPPPSRKISPVVQSPRATDSLDPTRSLPSITEYDEPSQLSEAEANAARHDKGKEKLNSRSDLAASAEPDTGTPLDDDENKDLTLLKSTTTTVTTIQRAQPILPPPPSTTPPLFRTQDLPLTGPTPPPQLQSQRQTSLTNRTSSPLRLSPITASADLADGPVPPAQEQQPDQVRQMMQYEDKIRHLTRELDEYRRKVETVHLEYGRLVDYVEKRPAPDTTWQERWSQLARRTLALVDHDASVLPLESMALRREDRDIDLDLDIVDSNLVEIKHDLSEVASAIAQLEDRKQDLAQRLSGDEQGRLEYNSVCTRLAEAQADFHRLLMDRVQLELEKSHMLAKKRAADAATPTMLSPTSRFNNNNNSSSPFTPDQGSKVPSIHAPSLSDTSSNMAAIAESTIRLQHMTEKNQALEKKLKRAKTNIAHLQQMVFTFQNDITATKMAILPMQQELDQCKSNRVEELSTIHSLLGGLQSNLGPEAHLSELHTGYSSALHHLTESISEAKRHELVMKQLQAMTEVYGMLQSRLEAYTAHNHSIREQNSRAVRDLDAKDMEIKHLESQLAWLKVNHDRMTSDHTQCITLQADTIKTLQYEVANLRQLIATTAGTTPNFSRGKSFPGGIASDAPPLKSLMPTSANGAGSSNAAGANLTASPANVGPTAGTPPPQAAQQQRARNPSYSSEHSRLLPKTSTESLGMFRSFSTPGIRLSNHSPDNMSSESSLSMSDTMPSALGIHNNYTGDNGAFNLNGMGISSGRGPISQHPAVTMPNLLLLEGTSAGRIQTPTKMYSTTGAGGSAVAGSSAAAPQGYGSVSLSQSLLQRPRAASASTPSLVPPKTQQQQQLSRQDSVGELSQQRTSDPRRSTVKYVRSDSSRGQIGTSSAPAAPQSDVGTSSRDGYNKGGGIYNTYQGRSGQLDADNNVGASSSNPAVASTQPRKNSANDLSQGNKGFLGRFKKMRSATELRSLWTSDKRK
ncbi:hypothetical protein RI367_001517 [Sorochytrium milnesiophthora]